MNNLRAPVIERIVASMERGFLTPHSFEVVFNNPDGDVVSVRFRDNQNFYFKIVAPTTKNNNSTLWIVQECPGINFGLC